MFDAFFVPPALNPVPIVAAALPTATQLAGQVDQAAHLVTGCALGLAAATPTSNAPTNDALIAPSAGGQLRSRCPLGSGAAIASPTEMPGTDVLTGGAIAANPADLDATEQAKLLYMREEEKLARDVYQTLYATWNLPIFANIATSEERHARAVQALLNRYGLTDPATDQPVGKFQNADLQALYDRLVAQGTQSLEAALAVGALIEETDIADLQTAIANTDQPDITTVYNQLLRGSENHLRSFSRNLDQQTGIPYAPQVLASDTYADLLAAPHGGPGQGSGQGQGLGQGLGQDSGRGLGGGQGWSGGTGQGRRGSWH